MKKTVVLLAVALSGLAACSPQIHLGLPGQGKLEGVGLVPRPPKEKILMIDVEGMISSALDTGLFSREKNAVSRVFERLELAARDPWVKAVVLRIMALRVEFEIIGTGYVNNLTGVVRNLSLQADGTHLGLEFRFDGKETIEYRGWGGSVRNALESFLHRKHSFESA